MRLKLIAASLALLLLAGCSANSVEDVLRMPQLPSEFTEFNDELNKIKNAGNEFISPSSGTNRQPIQLTDLDGDGVDEGIAFFKETSNDFSVYAYIFKKVEDSYVVWAKIEGPGNAIENVSYADLLGNGNNEIIIGWSVSDSDARAVTAYELQGNEMKKLCEIACQYYLVSDLDSNGISDLSVVYNDPADGKRKLAMYAKFQNSFIFRASTPLSQTTEPIRSIRAGNVADNHPAIFVENSYRHTGLMTDIVIYNDGKLLNVSCSTRTQTSRSTARPYAVYCEDVDQDGTLEVPSPKPLPGYENYTEQEVLLGNIWRSYDERRGIVDKVFTYSSFSDNWHITLPMEWYNHITVAKVGQKSGSDGITFYSYDEPETSPKALFTIYVLSGDERTKFAHKEGYIKLLERSDAIFFAKIEEKSYMGYDISENMLKERFRYREREWMSGEVVS